MKVVPSSNRPKPHPASNRVIAGAGATQDPVAFNPPTAFAEIVPGSTTHSRPDPLSAVFRPDLPSQMPQTVGELWALCLRYRRIVIGIGLVVAVLVVLNSMRATPLYESNASHELYSPPKPVNYQGNGFDEAQQFFDISRVNTQRERFLSTPVLQRALSTSDLVNGPSYRRSNRRGGSAAQSGSL